VESVAPLQQGLTVDRAYYLSQGADKAPEGPPLHAAQVGQRVTVRLFLTVTNDVYYLVLDDYIPAGSEILDTRLKASAQGEGDGTGAQVKPDPSQPFAQGWGSWYFHQPELYDDHITWSADHLAPGTYELTYTLEILQPGQYRVLPAQARQAYFPDVQGNSAGEVFEIKP
jgi:uncharacterized protein YfaS (alpha-2-macroglobulin family)